MSAVLYQNIHNLFFDFICQKKRTKSHQNRNAEQFHDNPDAIKHLYYRDWLLFGNFTTSLVYVATESRVEIVREWQSSVAKAQHKIVVQKIGRNMDENEEINSENGQLAEAEEANDEIPSEKGKLSQLQLQ